MTWINLFVRAFGERMSRVMRYFQVKNIKGTRVAGLALLFVSLSVGLVTTGCRALPFSMQHSDVSLKIEKGKALFNDISLGTNKKKCNTCHLDGSGLGKADRKSVV